MAAPQSHARAEPCIEFQPAREFSGIWINEFEGSRFVENGLSVADVPAPMEAERIWLDMESSRWANSEWRRDYGRVYRVRFRGRAACDMHRQPGFGPGVGGYGHFGMSHGMVVVDDLLEFVDIGEQPARPPSK